MSAFVAFWGFAFAHQWGALVAWAAVLVLVFVIVIKRLDRYGSAIARGYITGQSVHTRREHAQPGSSSQAGHGMTAVIFDLDGVLVNSEPYWQGAFLAVTRDYCQESGFAEPELELADMAAFQGGRVNDTMLTILTSLGHAESADPDTIEGLAAEVIAQVGAAFRLESAPITDNVRVARQLADRGVRIGVASSSAQTFIDLALEEIGLADAVTVTQSAYELEHGKPHPGVYQLALERLGVSAREAVAIEDSTTGIGSAVRADLATIWYLDNAEESYDDALARLRGHWGTGPTRPTGSA